MPLINVFSRRLKDQLVRKGFKFSGSRGDRITQPAVYTLMGKLERLSSREKHFCKVIGKLEKHDVSIMQKIKGDNQW